MSVTSSLLRPSTPEVMRRLNLPVLSDTHGLYTSCPFCRADLRAVDAFLLCSNKGCPWLAGNYVDLIRDVRRDINYDRSLTWLMKEFPEAYEGVTSPLSDIVPAAAAELTRQRLLFRFLYSLRSDTHGPDVAWMGAWLTNQQMDPSAVDLTMLRINQDKIHELSKLLDDMFGGVGAALNQLAAGPCFVVPYMTAPGWVTTLVFFNPKRNSILDVAIEDEAFQMSGMLQAMNWLRPVLCDSFIAAAFLNSQMQRVRPSMSSMGVWYRRNSPNKEVRHFFDKPVFALDTTSQEAPALAGCLRPHMPALTFSTIEELFHAGTIRERSWLEGVAHLLNLHSDQDGLTQAGRNCLRSIYLREDEQLKIAILLRKLGKHQAAAQVETIVGELTVLNSGKLALISKPSGYEIRESRKSPEAVSNFTAVTVFNVAFLQSQDLCHALRVHFDGAYYETLASRRHIESASEMERLIQMAVAKARTGQESKTLPVILSKPGFKYVVRHWKEHIATVPNKLGVTSLGWAHDRKEFVAPDFVVNMDGSRSADFVYHPEYTLFSHYTKADSINSPPADFNASMVQRLSPAARMILCLTMAATARAFLHRPNHAVCLRQNHRTQQVVEDVFKHLGQVRGVTSWASINEFTCGYPVYGFCPSNVLAAEVKGSPIIMTPGGVDCPLSDADVLDSSSIARAVKSALFHLPQWLMSSAEVKLPVYRHVFPSSCMQREGEWLLNEMLQGENVGSTVDLPYSYVDTYLANIGDAKEAGKRMTYDTRKQRVTMPCEDVDVDELELEMRALFGDNVERRGTSISADAPRVFGALHHFYGVYPRLTVYSS